MVCGVIASDTKTRKRIHARVNFSHNKTTEEKKKHLRYNCSHQWLDGAFRTGVIKTSFGFCYPNNGKINQFLCNDRT